MKSLRLSDLKTKSAKWFKNYGIVEKTKRTTLKSIEYFVNKSYEALPKKYKEYLKEEKDKLTNMIARSIYYDGDESRWNVYSALKERASSVYKYSGDRTAEYIYKLFREQRPDVYAKYNSYVYRLGYSSAKWFKDNFSSTQTGSSILVEISLPQKASGIVYNKLIIEFDFSGDLINLAEMG